MWWTGSSVRLCECVFSAESRLPQCLRRPSFSSSATRLWVVLDRTRPLREAVSCGTVQDSTVVCTVPELHGKSDFHIYYTRNYTGLSTIPATLNVFNGKTPLAWILSATFQGQQKGLFVDQKRCRQMSTFVPLSHAGLPGPPDQLHAFTCRARGQLLIRARAVWKRRGFAASIAVRSYATRKPVAFGFLNHSGFGGLYTSRGCVPHS